MKYAGCIRFVCRLFTFEFMLQLMITIRCYCLASTGGLFRCLEATRLGKTQTQEWKHTHSTFVCAFILGFRVLPSALLLNKFSFHQLQQVNIQLQSKIKNDIYFRRSRVDKDRQPSFTQFLSDVSSQTSGINVDIAIPSGCTNSCKAHVAERLIFDRKPGWNLGALEAGSSAHSDTANMCQTKGSRNYIKNIH